MPAIDLTVVLYRADMAELRKTLLSVASISTEFRRLRILVSGSDEEFSDAVDAVKELAMTDSTSVYHRYDNIGFASGHNALLQMAFAEEAQFCLVLNPDVSVAPGALSSLVEIGAEAASTALYGPALERQEPESMPDRRFDSNGIVWTPSGRHFDADMGEVWSIVERRVRSVAGLTGACLLVSSAAYDSIIAKTGWFFDDVFLAYREDAELGVRASSIGLESRLVELSGFRHVRSVRGAQRGRRLTDLLGVRNRFVMLFRLGRLRPGSRLGAALRDAIVILATLTVERSSIPGLRSAFRIRRYLGYTSRVRT